METHQNHLQDLFPVANILYSILKEDKAILVIIFHLSENLLHALVLHLMVYIGQSIIDQTLQRL